MRNDNKYLPNMIVLIHFKNRDVPNIKVIWMSEIAVNNHRFELNF